MRKIIIATLAAAAFSLSACGGDGDDALGDKAEDALEDQADAVEDAGEAREEAIDDSDVDTDGLSNAQKEGMVNGQ